MPSRSRRSSPSCLVVDGALAALLAFLAFLPWSGCASAPATLHPSEKAAPGFPWELPSSSFGTQRLFRMSYSGPRGEGSFRLALKIESAGRYQALAVDPLGRALWSLDVAAGKGLFLDHRARAACALEGSLSLVGAPLERIDLADLPKLLLGRVPVRPRGENVGSAGDSVDDEIDLDGAEGERWKVKLADGRPVRWTLLRNGKSAATWISGEDGSLLSDRAGGKLRWRAAVAEPLPGSLSPLPVPADYRKDGCSALELGEGD